MKIVLWCEKDKPQLKSVTSELKVTRTILKSTKWKKLQNVK